MPKVSLNDYSIVFLRLYTKDEKETSRLMEDLDYYLMEEKTLSKKLYYVCPNKFDIYITYKNDCSDWDYDSLTTIITNVLKKSRHMITKLKMYKGLMKTEFWEELSDVAEFYKDTETFRKVLKEKEIIEYRSKKVDKIVNKITVDDILNKINKSGFESLTTDEFKILKDKKEKTE